MYGPDEGEHEYEYPIEQVADKLPLNRQQTIFARHGVHLPRSTLANLVQGGATLLSCIVEAIWQHAREHAPWLAIDATEVLVLAAEQCRRGPSRSAVGHTPAGVFDALVSDRERALVGIGFIGLLYDAHCAATDPTTGVTDTHKRRAAAEPVLTKLYQWIDAQRPHVADDSPIAKAMNYLVNHREPLSRFLRDGQLRLDNNVSEIVSVRRPAFCSARRPVTTLALYRRRHVANESSGVGEAPDPQLLILDEPAAGLDPRARIELRDYVRLTAPLEGG